METTGIIDFPQQNQTGCPEGLSLNEAANDFCFNGTQILF